MVDDDEYEQIVENRRKHGDFVVDDGMYFKYNVYNVFTIYMYILFINRWTWLS